MTEPSPSCLCRTLDRGVLIDTIDEWADEPGFHARHLAASEQIHADVTAFATGDALTGMEAVVHAVEAVAGVPSYVHRALARAPAIARLDPGPMGAFMGYDFHLDAEGVLARRLFQANGVRAVVIDPGDLVHQRAELRANGEEIDLVYNRLTDFYLEDPAHAALGSAYEAGDIVLTPNPRHHALYADKRNLALLSDDDLVAGWGLDESDRTALATIPRTTVVTPETADELYARRKELFFKPFGGHGSKGVYRGGKITRRVWDAIREGDYVAQQRVPPRERPVVVDGETVQRKVDLRLYTYRGRTLLAAARLYQGQTTNFRTPGGGFAPLLPAGECPCSR